MRSRRRVLAVLGTATFVAASSTQALAVSSGLLDGFARPHPKFISGTAQKSAYFAKSHVYDTTYSTKRSDGSGRYPANSVSGWEVPKAAYPKGYDVSVKGGFVVSGTDDEELLIATGRHAKTVHLVIKPPSELR